MAFLESRGLWDGGVICKVLTIVTRESALIFLMTTLIKIIRELDLRIPKLILGMKVKGDRIIFSLAS